MIEVKWYEDNFFKVFGAVTDELLMTIGQQCVTWATQLCPVKTSNLTHSITHSTQKEQGNLRGNTNGKPLQFADKDTVNIGTNVQYAARIELGFTGRDSLGRYYNQPPKSFLRRSLQSHRNDIMNIIKMAYGK